MRLITLIACVTGLLTLTACQSLRLGQTSGAKPGDGVVVRRVSLAQSGRRDKKSKPMICYSEIKNDAISGLNCQNTLGVTLFAVGIKKSEIKLQKATPLIRESMIQNTIDALSLALFEHVNAPRLQNWSAAVNGKMTRVMQNKSLIAEISQ